MSSAGRVHMQTTKRFQQCIVLEPGPLLCYIAKPSQSVPTPQKTHTHKKNHIVFSSHEYYDVGASRLYHMEVDSLNAIDAFPFFTKKQDIVHFPCSVESRRHSAIIPAVKSAFRRAQKEWPTTASLQMSRCMFIVELEGKKRITWGKMHWKRDSKNFLTDLLFDLGRSEVTRDAGKTT